MSNWGWFWTLWFSLSIMVFAAGETLALIDPDSGDTLSENVRNALEFDWFKIPFMILFIGTFGWLIIHWFMEKNPDIGRKIRMNVRRMKGKDNE